MTEESIHLWLEKASNHGGILACGARLANHTAAARSFEASFPEARVQDLLQWLTDVSVGLRNSQIDGSRLRWVFEHGQIHSIRRPDGAFAVLLVGNDTTAAAAMEELFAQFLCADIPAPDPGTPEFSN